MFFDNYFTSVKLLRHFASEFIYAVGTSQETRTEKYPLKRKVNMKSKQKGLMIWEAARKFAYKRPRVFRIEEQFLNTCNVWYISLFSSILIFSKFWGGGGQMPRPPLLLVPMAVSSKKSCFKKAKEILYHII